MQINLTELFARDGKELDFTGELAMKSFRAPDGGGAGEASLREYRGPDADGGRKRKAFSDDSVQPLSGTGEGSILTGSCEDI